MLEQNDIIFSNPTPLIQQNFVSNACDFFSPLSFNQWHSFQHCCRRTQKFNAANAQARYRTRPEGLKPVLSTSEVIVQSTRTCFKFDSLIFCSAFIHDLYQESSSENIVCISCFPIPGTLSTSRTLRGYAIINTRNNIIEFFLT